ncbi:hypothetical protein AFFFEF_04322 [Methylorubrum extorquens]
MVDEEAAAGSGIVGPKPPLKPKHIWALRTRLWLANRTRDLALYTVGIMTSSPGGTLTRIADCSKLR